MRPLSASPPSCGTRFLLLAGALLVLLLNRPAAAHVHDDHVHIGSGHVDLSFCYENGVWRTGLVWDGTGGGIGPGPAPGTVRAADSAVILLRDQPYAQGSRVRRPPESEWAFTGTGSGEPFWWSPQAPAPASAWTGFSVCSSTGCGSYYEPDPRVAATAAWKTIELKRVRYLGKGSGRFSMWSTGTFGDLIVWMTTVDGIGEQDRYFIGNSGHSHPAMGFSALGLYEVTFCTTCYTGPGKTSPTTSPPVSFYFAVGTYWEWVARHWKPERWWQEGQTGEMDDPDGDSIPNLMEYACGLHPREAGRSETPGYGLPGLPAIKESFSFARYDFPRRDPATNPQIEVTVRATDDPALPQWPDQLVPEFTQGSTGWLAGTCLLNPSGKPRRFLRMEVTLLPEISYND